MKGVGTGPTHMDPCLDGDKGGLDSSLEEIFHADPGLNQSPQNEGTGRPTSAPFRSV